MYTQNPNAPTPDLYVWKVRANDLNNTKTFDAFYDRVTLDPAKLATDPDHAAILQRGYDNGTYSNPVYLKLNPTKTDHGMVYSISGANFDVNENGEK